MNHVIVLFHRFGPYHRARLRAAAERLRVTALELSAHDDTYAWAPLTGSDDFRRITLFNERDAIHEPMAEVVRRVQGALDESQPDVVAIPGWFDRGALAALQWCVRQRVPAIVMSESTAWDHRRVWWNEAIKRRIVGLCHCGLVGGRPHADYLAQLGMPRERIFLGYDVVDNDYFRRGADASRGKAAAVRQRLGLPERYFLASSRFADMKNLFRLIQAFARYRAAAGSRAWSLVLLGDGTQRPDLERLRDDLALREALLMPGFEQYDELPPYYALAGAFVLASKLEPWGLVVNEAMACGLPVLVSKRCGCALDLVQEGRNGFAFDPFDVEALAGHLLRMSADEYDRTAMGRASQEIIARWTPETFGDNLRRAAQTAGEVQLPRSRRMGEVLLKVLIRGQPWRALFQKG
jgi:glycosyltransferase involved in cell wall biosynthesis